MVDYQEHEYKVVALCKELESLRREIKIQIENSKENLILSRTDMERRLEGMNEFREELRMQANTFAVKSEEALKHGNIEERLRKLERLYDTRTAGIGWTDHLITVIIGAAVILTVYLIR